MLLGEWIPWLKWWSPLGGFPSGGGFDCRICGEQQWPYWACSWAPGPHLTSTPRWGLVMHPCPVPGFHTEKTQGWARKEPCCIWGVQTDWWTVHRRDLWQVPLWLPLDFHRYLPWGIYHWSEILSLFPIAGDLWQSHSKQNYICFHWETNTKPQSQ